MPDMIPVRVLAIPKEGFSRGGRRWPSTPTEDEVTPEQYAVLKAEKKLSVLRLDEVMTGATGSLGDEYREVVGANGELTAENERLKGELATEKRTNIALSAKLREAGESIEQLKAKLDAATAEVEKLKGASAAPAVTPEKPKK
jgi:hypothetical protein